MQQIITLKIRCKMLVYRAYFFKCEMSVLSTTSLAKKQSLKKMQSLSADRVENMLNLTKSDLKLGNNFFFIINILIALFRYFIPSSLSTGRVQNISCFSLYSQSREKLCFFFLVVLPGSNLFAVVVIQIRQVLHGVSHSCPLLHVRDVGVGMLRDIVSPKFSKNYFAKPVREQVGRTGRGVPR